jgi:hypothetical protein
MRNQPEKIPAELWAAKQKGSLYPGPKAGVYKREFTLKGCSLRSEVDSTEEQSDKSFGNQKPRLGMRGPEYKRKERSKC